MPAGKKLLIKLKPNLSKNIFNYIKTSLCLCSITGSIFSYQSAYADIDINNKNFPKKEQQSRNLNGRNIFWESISREKENNSTIIWKRLSENEINAFKKEYSLAEKIPIYILGSLNRSIVFNNKIIGPDISWLVPPGLSWNNRYKFDTSTRGHNRRKSGEKFFGWNGGDAVGQIYYQPIHLKNSSMGLNLGFRSVYQGTAHLGGQSAIGEGLSMGFRYDRELSPDSGIAIGAEQLIHFDGLTDTGRDLYVTLSKGWWKDKNSIPSFPLYVATAGIATGKMAEGNIKGLCSDLFGGSGTEVHAQRRLCWAPVFSIAKVYNSKFSTFFEYNSKWFLLGTSISPYETIPLRGTFAVQISDHIENYKLNNLDNMKWVFRISLGF
tara:strand:- start:596 stop:1735 length:1140 start_codon:yes stop_codon:yes gene_type:complete